MDNPILRLGRWQDVLDGVRADTLISDPPYSKRTHSGHDNGVRSVRLEGEEARQRVDRRDGSVYSVGISRRKPIRYEPWTDKDVYSFVASWSPRIDGWFVVLTDHILARVFEAALSEAGRYVFAPLPFVAPGSRVRLQGDGPSSWTTWIVVARPKGFMKWGTLPGAYVLPRGCGEKRDQGTFVGGKPLWLMRALVRDYSRRGDLIVDPCCGSATTLVAAVTEGREALGSEADIETYEHAVKRIERPQEQTFDW